MSDTQPPGFLGRVRAAVGGRRSPEPAGSAPPRRGGPLVAAGVFDREFYEAQAGRTFESDFHAAEHCVSEGAGRLSPHPLLDYSYLTPWHRDRFRISRNAMVILDYLRGKGLELPLGPLFDSRLVEGGSAVGQHPAGALGHFLATSGADAALPGRPGLTLTQARPSLIAAARQIWAEARERDRPRITTTWDADAERVWRDRWSDAPLPTSDLPSSDGPVVSVIMPVRNRSAVVTTAIASVQAQTLDRWELLVVDDGSTDETREVVRALADSDARIRLITQEWAGVCAARNTGLAGAAAPYVAFLDSDNAWRPDFLRLAIAAMHGEGLVAAYAALTYHADGERIFRGFPGGLADLMVINHVDLNVLVVRTELAREVGGFDESLRRWVDHDFAIRVAKREKLTLLPFLGVDYEHSMDIPDRITTTESEAWQFVVLAKHWVDWAGARARADMRVPGRVSIVIPTWNDARMTIHAVDAALRTTEGLDVEVIVVDNGSTPDVALALVAGITGRDRVRIERLPRNLNFATGCNVGAVRSDGEFVLFLNNDTEPRPGWLEPLVAELADPQVLGAQPLLLYEDDAIQTAGTVFPVSGTVPVHFLVGHPKQDAQRMPNRDFHAVTAAALLMRADDVLELEGFDPHYVNGMEDVDLCLRAVRLRPGTFRVVTDSEVTHLESRTSGRRDNITPNRLEFIRRWKGTLPPAEGTRWAQLGFEVAHVGSDLSPVPAPRPVLVRRPTGLTDPGTPLRWGLRLPAPPELPVNGTSEEAYRTVGRLAADVGLALERAGHQVVTHRADLRDTLPLAYDDVLLGLRGPTPVYASPGQLSLLWVVTDPGSVTAEEMAYFTLVFAADERAAAGLSALGGRDVRVLSPTGHGDLDHAARTLGDAVRVLIDTRD